MSLNPIIPGFSPDPSIVFAEGHYFLVTSTFHLFPGLPIYVSKDLVTWKHLGNAFNRREQLSLAKSETNLHPQENGRVMLAQGGLFAPTIRYNEGIFYVINTNVIHPGEDRPDETENFILSTSDIWNSKWSGPIYFGFDGIDPSIFFDDDGKAYITGSRGPGPWTKVDHFEINVKTGEKLSEQKEIWAGTGGIYPEGPHIYKRDGKYYLLISEGGTYDDHMITVARSESIWGPYEANPKNPILTARGTDEYIQHTGHCDMFEDAAGNAWGVCLGSRKDREGRHIMGRETFITGAKWEDGWPTLDLVKSNPPGLKTPGTSPSLTENPLVDLLYIRDAHMPNYEIAKDASTIKLTATDVDLSAPTASPTFIGRRQRKLDGNASVTMNMSTGGDLRAGLACYKDEHRYVRVYVDASQKLVFECRNNGQKIHNVEEVSGGLDRSQGNLVQLKMAYSEKHYEVYFKTSTSEKWTSVGRIDSTDLSDMDFVGPVIGVFAVSKESGRSVEFRDLIVD